MKRYGNILFAPIFFLNVSFLAALASAATLTVEFKAQEGEPADYEEVNVLLINMETARSPEDAIKFTTREKTFTHSFENLPAGDYVILAFTGTFAQVNDASRPGAFRTQDHLTLADDAAEETITIQYETMDGSAWVGTETAKGRALDGRKNPVVGVELNVARLIETAGLLTIETVRTGDDGRFAFSKLAPGKTYEITNSQGDIIGEISAGEDIAVEIPIEIGAAAPDVPFVHLESGDEKRLSDFKGKVVVLEFWASWCGPCQAPMAKMQTYREKHPDWGDRVELLALSIDDEKKTAEDHLKKNGWNSTNNVWAGEGGFRAEAPQAYGVRGIPAVFLIDQEGKIAASGHPMTIDMPALIDDLLAKQGK